MPGIARPDVAEDNKPLFVLRGVTVVGARVMSNDQLVASYQSYLGKKVSQSDLAAIAGHISDLYRGAGFHLSRAIVPPQDIPNGVVRIEVIEGSITEVALKGDGAEQFGVRPLLDPVLAEHPSRLATLERQLLPDQRPPGVLIVDTALEEIGGADRSLSPGRGQLKTWHIYTSFGFDNLGSSSVGPWQSYATAALNSYLLPGDSLALNLSTTPNDPRELAFRPPVLRRAGRHRRGADRRRRRSTARCGRATTGGSSTTRPGPRPLNCTAASFRCSRSELSLTLTAAAEFSNVSERDVFGPIYDDHIRTLSLTSDYRLQDGFGGNNYHHA